MYLHLGQETVIKTKNIIGIFDLDTSTVGKSTRDFLARSEKEKEVYNVSYELPKAFVLCNENDKNIVYISQIATSTLLKRSKNLVPK